MAQPCQPLLNPVPNGTSGSPFPAPLTSADIPTFDQNPGFGDLAAATLGDAASDADGFDAAVAAVSTSIDEWDVANAAQDATLDAILAQLEAADSSPVDASLTNYTDSFGEGNSIVAGAAALSVPTIGPLNTLWVFPGTSEPAPPAAPGQQVPGQITAGDPAFTWQLEFTAFNIGPGGISAAALAETTDVFTSIQLVSATPGAPQVPGGGTSAVPTYDVKVAIGINPHASGAFNDTVILTADYPAFGDRYPHRITLQVQPKS
jgi:hypothetical protein